MSAITDVRGIGNAVAATLAKYGFITVGDLAKAKILDLVQVPGFQEARAASVIAEARRLTGADVKKKKNLKTEKNVAGKSSKKKGKKEVKMANKKAKKTIKKAKKTIKKAKKTIKKAKKK